MRSGELFAGVGGLGMAVDEVFGSAPAWFCEFDTAPSKVLAYRHPDVPNYGDVTAVDWTTTPRVNILAGGFPCQDVSLAGRRKGMGEGTRSGLWSEFAKAIDEIRPDWVVIENVRGLLSANANSDVEPCPWCLGDGGEQHALRALGAVLGDLAELGFDAEWTGIRASDIGAPHGRFRVFILAWPRDRVSPDASSFGRGEGRAESARFVGRSHDVVGGSSADLTLLPTPIVSDGTGGSKNIDASDFSPQVRVIAKLLPTPTAMDSSASGGSNESNVTLTDAVVRTELGSKPNTRLLPTPGAYDGERGGSQHPDKRRAGNHSVTIQDVAEHLTLMPTPRASRGGSATETMYGLGAERVDDERAQWQVVADVTDWGPYADAIARWETVIGRPAPSPVRMDGKGGKPRLNPELTEWMMGWPAGHVTAPAIGLTRAGQLKACGNGVVPQQAAAALHELLARPGVPEIEIRNAA